MGNYHDDLRIAAQEVVDANKELERVLYSTKPPVESQPAFKALNSSIDRLKRILDSDENYNV